VSTGVKIILNSPAIIEPPAALTITGNFFVLSKESIKLRNIVLEKVSPKRDKGPYNNAGANPIFIKKIVTFIETTDSSLRIESFDCPFYCATISILIIHGCA